MITDNLISYYKLDGNSNDSKGSNNGTDTDIVYSAGNGKIVQGAGLNGITSKIVAKTSLIISNQTNASISLWLKNTLAQSASINGYTLYSERATSGNDIWKFEVNSGKIVSGDAGKLDFVHRDDANTLDNLTALTSVKVNDGAWHHCVLTKAGTSIIIYIDAVVKGSATLAGTDTMTDVNEAWIGDDKGDTAALYGGAIDEVGIWNRTLTQAEITYLYGGGDPFPLTIGKTTIGATDQSTAADAIQFIRITGVAGLVSSASFYSKVDSGTTVFKAALYVVSSGVFVASSNQGIITTIPDWITVTFPGGVTITAQDYYLCVFWQSGVHYFWDAGSAVQGFKSGVTYPTFPDPLAPTSSNGTRYFSLYLTYTIGTGLLLGT